ncbi:hypothetical protein MASR2M66_31350 [Chloroflexota bacterium]
MKKYIFGLSLLLLISACTMPVSAPAAESTPTQTPLSAPTTVRAAPSLVPTETAVPTPEPLPLYFTDEFDTSSPYWEFLQAAGNSAPQIIYDGNLRINFPSADTWFVGVHNAHTYANVFVNAKMSISPNGSVGLICRYSESGWYEFNAANGAYSILFGQWLSPGVAKYIPIVTAQSNLLAGGSSHDLGLFCEDNFVHTFVNDTPLRRIEVTNYGLTEGNVGIAAASFVEVPAEALFENFSVNEK